MIAKAFAKKRDKGNEDEEDRLSLSFESVSHDDAIGMWANHCVDDDANWSAKNFLFVFLNLIC